MGADFASHRLFAGSGDVEAAPFRGKPGSWADLLVDPGEVPALRAAWVHEWQAREILASTGRLLGWEDELLWVGYTHDDEGLPTRYDEFLEDSGVDLGGFEEFHFARDIPGSPPLPASPTTGLRAGPHG